MKFVTKDALILTDPWDLHENQPYADTVFEDDRSPKKSSLVDHLGRPLYIVPDPRQPIGFRLRK